MAYVYSEAFKPENQWRGVVQRSSELLPRIAHGIFFPGERFSVWLDADGLGAWVAVWNTTRPEALLRAVKQQAFPSFGFLGMMFDGGRYWTRFRAL